MAAFKQESARIGAHTYKVTQLDALKGRRAFTRLAKLLGPAFAQLQGEGTDDEKVARALTSLVDRMSEDDVDFFCDAFAELTEVSGGAYKKAAPQLDTVFATHFAGNYLEMTRWLIFAMKVNFSSFFGGAGALLGQAASASTSPTTSTGSSGDS
jgi:hypothetical protein